MTTKNWTELIDDIYQGKWVNPVTQEVAPPAPYEKIVIEESLAGLELQLVADLGLHAPYLIVADSQTWQAMGKRLSDALKQAGDVEHLILEKPHADLATVEKLRPSFKKFASIIAVGSGTINDLCKHASMLNQQSYCVFATAGSMNGYTSTTASMTLDSGLKVSLPSHAPLGFFVDLSVSANAPSFLSAAGFGDCLCRSVAQVDWWMSHRLLDTTYYEEPFLMQIDDEKILNAKAKLLPNNDVEAVAYLYRVLTLCGLGVSLTGTSHHGSMGEHQISHYIDCFAKDKHPGSLHGQQVGVASLTMARIQQHFLSSEKPPVVKPTKLNFDDMAKRMGNDIAKQCYAEYQKKALDEQKADALNKKMQDIWKDLRKECLEFSIPIEEMEDLLRSTKGPTTAKELKLDIDFYREAVRHAHEMRNRFSFADLACDAGLLDDFASAES